MVLNSILKDTRSHGWSDRSDMPLAAVLETRDRLERRTSMRDTQATADVQTEGLNWGSCFLY